MSESSRPQPERILKFPWLIVLFSVLLFFIFSVVIAYRSIVVMAANNQNVTNTLHVISLIDALKAELYAAESGQRGYLVTSDLQYLKPYEEALVSIDNLLETLRHTTSELPQQRLRYEQLNVITQEKLKEMRETVRLVQVDKERAAYALLRSDKGIKLMRSISAQIEEMLAEEFWLLSNYRQLAERNRNLVMATLIVTNVVGLMLAIIVYVLVYRNAKRVARLYDEIERANQELEEKVESRTKTLVQYADELERSNRELETFAFVASHDLQEPLRKIRAFGDRLIKKFGPQLGEQGADYVKRMHSASERMSVLIDDLLSFSRVTTRKKPFEPVDLNELMQATLDDLQYAIDDSGAKITVDPLPEIVGDASQIGQVFINLLSNSLKFRQKDVQPEITVRCEVGAEHAVEGDEREWVCLRFADNGIGFDPQYADRVFSIFQRLHGQDQYKGTGIGLALCRKIIERHGGSIEASSEPGKGAVFTIKLPRTQPAFDNLEEGLAL